MPLNTVDQDNVSAVERHMFNTLASYENDTAEALKYMLSMQEMLQENYPEIYTKVNMARTTFGSVNGNGSINTQMLSLSHIEFNNINRMFISIGLDIETHSLKVHVSEFMDDSVIFRLETVLKNQKNVNEVAGRMDSIKCDVFCAPVAQAKEIIDLVCYHYLDARGLIPEAKKPYRYTTNQDKCKP